MDFLKSIGGKVTAGIVVLLVVVGAISWWQMDSAGRQEILNGAGKIGAWFGVVLLVPWASFFLIGRVAKFESNAAGALLVFGYTAVEAGVLIWLFRGTPWSSTAWVFFTAAVLVAGVYNLLTCDWIAEKVSGA